MRTKSRRKLMKFFEEIEDDLYVEFSLIVSIIITIGAFAFGCWLAFCAVKILGL